MYNLLILDDEPAVVNSLAHNIAWEEQGIAHVFKATSADQALELMQEYRIDLVISDIRMPGMDGLDFTEAICSLSPHTKVIIMSGLDEFRLAQRAILLNVFRYMTKPVPYVELILVVQEALARLEAELEQLQLLENAEQTMASARPILQERFLQQWIVRGADKGPKGLAALDPCGLDIREEWPCLLLLVRVDEWHRENTDPYQRLKLQKLVDEILFHGTKCTIFNDFERQLVVLAQQNSPAKLQAAKRYMEGMAELLLHTAKRSLGCTLSLFWSGQLFAAGTVHEEYIRLKERARFTMAWESGIIQGDAAEPACWEEEQQALFGYPGFEQWVERLDKAQALVHLRQWFDGSGGKKPARTYDMLLLLYNTVSASLIKASLKRKVPLKEWAKEETSIFYSMQMPATVSRLRAWALRVTELYMDYMSDRSQHATSRLLSQAK
ncbi:MAG: DNA-binding response regulator, partial [Paenibacillaceae bacterium]|nr:DNA-binding response regulator [Paenibacillaceae bacterium]